MKSSLIISWTLIVIALIFEIISLIQHTGLAVKLIGAVFIIFAVANLVIDLRRERR